MQTYGGGKTSIKTFTDISYLEEAEVPSTKLSEYVELISKGIISDNANEWRQKLFEATLLLWHIPFGSNLDDIKWHL